MTTIEPAANTTQLAAMRTAGLTIAPSYRAVVGVNAANAPLAPAPAGVKQDTFAADTVDVVVQWPAVLSRADYDDITGWLVALKREIGRSVPSPDQPKSN